MSSVGAGRSKRRVSSGSMSPTWQHPMRRGTRFRDWQGLGADVECATGMTAVPAMRFTGMLRWAGYYDGPQSETITSEAVRAYVLAAGQLGYGTSFSAMTDNICVDSDAWTAIGAKAAAAQEAASTPAAPPTSPIPSPRMQTNLIRYGFLALGAAGLIGVGYLLFRRKR